MRLRMRRNALVWGALLLAAILSITIGINASETPKKIRIIYTNDTLGVLDPCG